MDLVQSPLYVNTGYFILIKHVVISHYDFLTQYKQVLKYIATIILERGSFAIGLSSNQITFIVTSPQHMCLGEWNSWERAPDSAETIYI